VASQIHALLEFPFSSGSFLSVWECSSGSFLSVWDVLGCALSLRMIYVPAARPLSVE
jgi:hypothetical protein